MKINNIVVVLLYVLLFSFTLVPFYVEGDDASTVIHHVLGEDLQPKYSVYHGMFDKFLSLFGHEEIVLRKVGIYASFLASLFSLLLLMYLMKLKEVKLYKFSFFIPLIIAEFLFWGLLINPTTIAFVFVLLAHVFLLKHHKKKTISTILMSILFFGLGVSFRWSIGFYLFVLYAEYIFKDGSEGVFSKRYFNKSFYIFPLYLASVLIFVYLSGYTPLDIYNTYASGAAYMENKEVSYLSLFATGITFLTPVFLFLFCLSIFWAIKQRKYKSLYILSFSLIPYVLLGFYPSLKYMITIIPALFLLILDTEQFYKIKVLKYSVLVLVILPFVFGIQINSNSAWGPSFDIKIFSKEKTYQSNSNFNPDKSTKVKKTNVVFVNSGCAMPTPEGPRPLWGFGSVLLKDWKHLIIRLDHERADAITYANQNGLNILQDVNHSFLSTKLVEMNFTTNELFQSPSGAINSRSFVNNGNKITVKVPNDKNKLFDIDYINSIDNGNELVLYSTYTNIISKLEKSNTINFEQKGSYWGVVKNEIHE